MFSATATATATEPTSQGDIHDLENIPDLSSLLSVSNSAATPLISVFDSLSPNSRFGERYTIEFAESILQKYDLSYEPTRETILQWKKDVKSSVNNSHEALIDQHTATQIIQTIESAIDESATFRYLVGYGSERVKDTFGDICYRNEYLGEITYKNAYEVNPETTESFSFSEVKELSTSKLKLKTVQSIPIIPICQAEESDAPGDERARPIVSYVVAPGSSSKHMSSWREGLIHEVVHHITGSTDPQYDEAINNLGATEFFARKVASEVGWKLPNFDGYEAPERSLHLDERNLACLIEASERNDAHSREFFERLYNIGCGELASHDFNEYRQPVAELNIPDAELFSDLIFAPSTSAFSSLASVMTSPALSSEASASSQQPIIPELDEKRAQKFKNPIERVINVLQETIDNTQTLSPIQQLEKLQNKSSSGTSMLMKAKWLMDNKNSEFRKLGMETNVILMQILQQKVQEGDTSTAEKVAKLLRSPQHGIISYPKFPGYYRAVLEHSKDYSPLARSLDSLLYRIEQQGEPKISREYTSKIKRKLDKEFSFPEGVTPGTVNISMIRGRLSDIKSRYEISAEKQATQAKQQSELDTRQKTYRQELCDILKHFNLVVPVYMEKILTKQHIELSEVIFLQYKQKEEIIQKLRSSTIDTCRININSYKNILKVKNDALSSGNKNTARSQVRLLKDEIKTLERTLKMEMKNLKQQYARHSMKKTHQLKDVHHEMYQKLLEQLFEKGVYIENPDFEKVTLQTLVSSKEVRDIIAKAVRKNVIYGDVDKKKAIELARINVAEYIKDSLWYKNKMQRIEKSFDNLKKQTQLSSDYASSPSDIKKIVDQATKGEITHTIEQQVKQQAVDIAYQYTRKLAEQEAEHVARQEAEKEAWRLAEHFVRQEAEKEAHQQAERFIQQEAKKEARRQAQSFVEKEAARHINDVTEQYAAQFFKIDANLEQAKLDFNLDREEEALMDRRLKNLRSGSSHAQGSRQAELLDSDGKPKIVTI